jgi:hypothetical protein
MALAMTAPMLTMGGSPQPEAGTSAFSMCWREAPGLAIRLAR